MPRLPSRLGLLPYNRLSAVDTILGQYAIKQQPAVVADPYPDRSTFYVVLSQGSWRIIFRKERSPKTFSNQQSAAQYAVIAARGLAAAGFPAQVRVQGVDRRWRLEWTYLNDPFPPRG